MSHPATPGARSEKEIFFEALERCTPQERMAFLDGACGTNPVQRARVEALLADHFQQDAFMRDPAVEAPPLFSPEPAPPETPAQILGRYKLLEKIGEGGFGEVWMAEQREPVRRRVALKIIKLGMDSRQVVARFEAERQALAMMDHANIARIFDADVTDTGRPYFVMELVRGTRITDYCDQNELPTRERLDLFIKVCQAIQHAHQKGIIHRDIKPSNILVTLHDGVPVPKVIDFGIAKATQNQLTDKTLFTQFQQFIGTPAYISPEQAELSGLDIDTRADIYSLGVLLYELLVGQTPIDAKEMMKGGLDALRQIIREREPQRPSTRLHTLAGEALTTAAKRRRTDELKLLVQLQGDLDWIVMKCLEKDRARRYDTANGLVMDIQRHLANEPVVARPPSTAYRIQKAWQRNKLAFTAVGSVVLALLAGTGVSTWQAVEATRSRKEEAKQRIAAQDAQSRAAVLQNEAEEGRQLAQTQLTRAEWLVYAGRLSLAQTDFETGNGGRALQYLDECQQKLRGWEYRYLRTRISAALTINGRGGAVTSVACSPDGRRIVTASEGRTANVWDSATGASVTAFKEHKSQVLSAAFTPDGTRIVTGGGEWSVGEKPGEVKVWDAATGHRMLDLKGHSYCVWGVAVSPGGKRIVSGAGDWANGPGEVKVWDAETGQPLIHLKPQRGAVCSVTFSPDGKRLLTGNNAGAAKLWDALTGDELQTLPHAERVTSVAFSAEGTRLVTGSSDRTVKVWDTATGTEIFPLKGHAGPVRSVAFSPNGQRIITGSDDGTAKVWNAVTGQEIPILRGHRDFISSIAFSPDSKYLVTGSGDGTARVWDAATGAKSLILKEPARTSWQEAAVWGVAFNPDGQRIITGSNDKTAEVWDAVTGTKLLAFAHTSVVSSVAFSRDGTRTITGIGEWGDAGKKPGGATVWDASTGLELLSFNPPNVVWSVAFSPDGNRIVTGGGSSGVQVWDSRTKQQVLNLTGHAGAVRSVAFSPDGRRILTGSDDWTARVWDARGGKEILPPLKSHAGAVHSVAFSPDGRRIVTGSADRTARIWEAETGHELLSLTGHTAEVWSVAFSPDGNRVATGISGIDATVRVWSAGEDK